MERVEARASAELLLCGPADRPLAVVGVTDPQTCLVLRARVRVLREAGYRVVLICSPGTFATQLASAEEIAHVQIPMERGIAPVADFLSFFRLWAALKRLRPVLTEFSTPKAGLLGNLAAQLCGVPTRIYLLRGLRFETATGVRRLVLKATEWLAGSSAHVVICNSASLRQQARRFHLAPESKLHLIAEGSSNGVDVAHFIPGPDCMRTRLGIANNVPVVGFVGRLTRDKGIPELLDAFERVLRAIPAARLLLVGWFDHSEDALSPRECAVIEAHPAVIHTGFVPDAAPYYRAMDVMALPTWREGFPNAVLEAAASGIPVITTFATGARDSVLPGVTGLLVPAGDPVALADSILTLLRDPEMRAMMGRAARRRAVEQFTDHRVLGQTVAFYNDLLRKAEMETAALSTDVAALAD